MSVAFETSQVDNNDKTETRYRYQYLSKNRHDSKVVESSLQIRCVNGGWFCLLTPVGRQ